jgi:hypothetical protein
VKFIRIELIAIIAGCLACFTLGIFAGWSSYHWKVYQSYSDNITNIDQGTALDWLYQAEYSHQHIIDNPELATGGLSGDIQFHKDCTRRYQEIQKFILNHCEN